MATRSSARKAKASVATADSGLDQSNATGSTLPVVSSTRTKRTISEAIELPDLDDIAEAHRERLSSFSSTSSDELDLIDREMEAQEAAMKHEKTKKKKKAKSTSTRTATDPKPPAPVLDMLSPGQHLRDEVLVDLDIDHFINDMYQRVEEDTILDVIGNLQEERYQGVSADVNDKKDQLWDVVATPQMFKEFSQTVANGNRVTATSA